jgi:hypothetical protein
VSSDVWVRIPPLALCDVSGHRSSLGRWLVVPGRVEGELAEQGSSGLVQDADVPVDHQDQQVGAGVAAAQADVVQAAVVAQG